MNEKLRTKLLITRRGKPAGVTRFRLSNTQLEMVTDSRGQLDIEIDVGRSTIHVFRDGEWIPHFVETGSDSSLMMLDLAQDNTLESFERSRPDTNFVDIGQLNLGERYVFEEVIGRGGMSVVLKAHDRLLDRSVAVKMLSEELQNQPDAQEIFLTEARSLATLSHPNLVSVHDICSIDNRVFMVIELIDGQNLEKLVLSLKGFKQQLAMQTFIQLARVVGYLHNKGVLHRDLKPANAMIRRDGTLKLIDFGLARKFDELFVRGTRVRGTPAYMSPEQILGKPLNSSTDIYQIGVVMFETLTGVLPFRDGDIGYAHVHLPPPRVDFGRADIHPLLADLVDECLSKNPDDRPKDANVLMRRLQALYVELGGTDQSYLSSITESSSSVIRRPTHSEMGLHRTTDGAPFVESSPSPIEVAGPAVGERHWAPILIGLLVAVVVGAAAFYYLTRDLDLTQRAESKMLVQTVAPEFVEPKAEPAAEVVNAYLEAPSLGDAEEAPVPEEVVQPESAKPPERPAAARVSESVSAVSRKPVTPVLKAKIAPVEVRAEKTPTTAPVAAEALAVPSKKVPEKKLEKKPEKKSGFLDMRNTERETKMPAVATGQDKPAFLPMK